MGKDRIEERTRSALRALLKDSRSEREICIMDMSTRGLLATTANPPRRGEFVELTIGRNSLSAQVKWASQRRFGLSLRERVSVAALLEGGKQPIALKRSRAMQPTRVGLLASLRANPQMLSRVGQYGVFVLGAVIAGYFIITTMESGFAPLQQAMATLGSGKTG